MRISTNFTGPTRRNRSAFSTLEALIASGIMGVLVASLYGGITFGIALIQSTREKLRGGQVLQEKLETIRLYKWQQINDASFLPRTFSASLNPTGNVPFYEGTFTIAPVPFGSETYKSDMLQVDVSVQWKSLGTVKTMNLQTFVSRHGIQNYSF
jgi:Tfp pilus assembly protein PilV